MFTKEQFDAAIVIAKKKMAGPELMEFVKKNVLASVELKELTLQIVSEKFPEEELARLSVAAGMSVVDLQSAHMILSALCEGIYIGCCLSGEIHQKAS